MVLNLEKFFNLCEAEYMTELKRYVESLNIKKISHFYEIEYIIDNNYSITIENFTNIFIIKRHANNHIEKYTSIYCVEQLKDFYHRHIGDNIEHLRRKEKLKNLICYQKKEEEK